MLCPTATQVFTLPTQTLQQHCTVVQDTASARTVQQVVVPLRHSVSVLPTQVEALQSAKDWLLTWTFAAPGWNGRTALASRLFIAEVQLYCMEQQCPMSCSSYADNDQSGFVWHLLMRTRDIQ